MRWLNGSLAAVLAMSAAACAGAGAPREVKAVVNDEAARQAAAASAKAGEGSKAALEAAADAARNDPAQPPT